MLTVPVVVVAMALLVAALLVGEARHLHALRIPAKAAASTCFFLLLAAADIAMDRLGMLLAVALAFGWLGDVLLLGRSRAFFLSGLAAFLVGHIAYAVLFASMTPDVAPTVVAGGAALTVGTVVFVALRARIPAGLQAPVVAYIVAISAMVGLAAGVATRVGVPGIAIGAAAFLLSDVAVALDRFTGPAFVYRAWGLPLYYGSQALLVLALAKALGA